MVAGPLEAWRLSLAGPCGGAVSIGEFFPAARACLTILALCVAAIREAPGQMACDDDRFLHSNTKDVTHTALS